MNDETRPKTSSQATTWQTPPICLLLLRGKEVQETNHQVAPTPTRRRAKGRGSNNNNMIITGPRSRATTRGTTTTTATSLPETTACRGLGRGIRVSCSADVDNAVDCYGRIRQQHSRPRSRPRLCCCGFRCCCCCSWMSLLWRWSRAVMDQIGHGRRRTEGGG